MLINCVAYQEGKRVADIEVAAIPEHLKNPDGFVWVALRDADAEELSTMGRIFDLHELAVEDANHGHQRPKVEEYGDTVFAVVHTIDFIPGPKIEIKVGEIDIFAGPSFVVSVRNRSDQSLLGVRQRAEKQPHLLSHGSGFVMYALMDAVVDRYFPAVDALSSELDEIESRIFDRGAGRANVEALYALKRQVTTVKHAVAPLLEGVGRLVSGRVPQVCEANRDYFRDVYDHLERINLLLDGLRDTINSAMQVNLSVVTIEEAENSKRLAAWAGIFALATAFFGVWGMNFQVMPELQWKYGYPVALVVVTLACFTLWRRFKRTGWL